MFASIRRHYPIYLFLILITAAIYWQVADFQFTNLDDSEYVTQDSHVKAGFTPRDIGWAFVERYDGNWIPLTWISLMLDHEIGSRILTQGVEPGEENPRVYHLSNLVLHIVNTLLLFAVLNALTGFKWRSAFVAALFAVHPLHVESVAWVTERKDVLSTAFWMLGMLAYVRYVERPGIARYLLVMAALALGLMAKSMLVTLPVVLLLLDFWPLRRLAGRSGDKTSAGRSLWELIREKMPLFLLALAASGATFFMQDVKGAVSGLEGLSIGVRFANALVSYVKYIYMMLLPRDLMCFYPHPGNTLPVMGVLGCGLLLLALSLAAAHVARKRPYVSVGWFWYVVTLLPVIGIVQVGGQEMADRYTYVPLIGLFILIAWSVPDLLSQEARKAAPIAAGAVIAALMACSYVQIGYWHDDHTLYGHALRVMENNVTAHRGLAIALTEEGKLKEAAVHYTALIAINNNDYGAHIHLADILGNLGKTAEAVRHYREGLRLHPDRWDAQNNLAVILATDKNANLRNPAEAVRLAEAACRGSHYRQPEVVDTLAAAYAATGRYDEATVTAKRAMELARANHRQDLAADMEKRMQLYKAHQPYLPK